jgi:hypothetical protein
MSDLVNLIKPDDSDDSTTEFYTVEATGESGMSQSGLAVLCGVSQPAISQLEKTLISKAPSKVLEPFVGQCLTLISNSENTVSVNGKPVGNLTVYKASFCAAVIRHYDRQGNEVAQYSADQFIEMGINSWIHSITGWSNTKPTQTYIPYWYQRLTLFTARTRIPDGWWSVFEELAKMMRELESYGYVLPDVSRSTGQKITPDISIGQMFCRHMRAQNYDIDGEVQKYTHFYPDGRIVQANIYPDKWLELFRTWFNNSWKPQRLRDYLKARDPESLPSIDKLLGLLPEGE